MIDLHSHVLPDIDDGPEDLAESLALLRSMADDGVTRVAATPHVREDWPTTAGQMEWAVAALRDAAAREGIEVDVLPGGEIGLDRLGALDPAERLRFGLGGNPQALLVEFPYVGWPLALETIVAGLVAQGVRPVIAHPERNREVQERHDRLEPIVRAGALVQLTGASLDGRISPAAQACSRRLLELGLAHLAGSDAHGRFGRGAGLSRLATVVGDELASWLTVEVPAAVLASAPLPPRPAALRRRFPRLRL